MKVASMTAEIIGNEQIILLAKPDIAVSFCRALRPVPHFSGKKKPARRYP